MTFHIHRPRQAVGLLYIVMYFAILFAYVFVMEDDRSWMTAPKFTATVAVWFILSMAVKVSMLADRTIELLNVAAMAAFLSIGFTYHPNPYHPNAIQNFCYYLYVIGGSACDLFDFIYEGASRRPEDTLAGPDKQR